jgi:hypothetical protein
MSCCNCGGSGPVVKEAQQHVGWVDMQRGSKARHSSVRQQLSGPHCCHNVAAPSRRIRGRWRSRGHLPLACNKVGVQRCREAGHGEQCGQEAQGRGLGRSREQRGRARVVGAWCTGRCRHSWVACGANLRLMLAPEEGAWLLAHNRQPGKVGGWSCRWLGGLRLHKRCDGAALRALAPAVANGDEFRETLVLADASETRSSGKLTPCIVPL